VNVLVTGATGYIGGRLIPRLLQKGHSVRVMVRDSFRIQDRSWVDDVEIVQADLLAPESLAGAFDGIEAAYYLVHSMQVGDDFDQRDREAAENFCRHAGSVDHVVYLGGLLPRRRGKKERSVSKHLLSRAEIGRILSRHTPLTELRAGPIIGSGSASFEMVRYITERFPVMLAPKWVENEVQPIAIRDVLSYLLHALDRGPCGAVEIGDDPISYKQMMCTYAELRGLRRWVLPVPRFFSGRLSAKSIDLWTPIPLAIVAPLIEGMAEPLRAQRFRARHCFPQVKPMRYRQALQLALERMEERAVETRWSGAGSESAECVYQDQEGLIRDVRTIRINARPEAVFRVLSGLGGDRGWPAWGWAYRARGVVDRLLGGPGLRRGRRDPEELLTGETVDFWRVGAIAAPHMLRLCGDIEFPARTWLQWEVESRPGGTHLTQTVTLAPRGLSGALRWYSLFPVHRWFFARTLRAIGKEATRVERLAAARRGEAAPPAAPESVLGDMLHFFLRRPRLPTLIAFRSKAARENYCSRIMQRLGIDVGMYSVLNIHQIGIDAPVQSVFQELLQWNGHSSCWPNHVARVERSDGRIERIEIHPLGLKRIPFGQRSRIGWTISPLFVLNAREIQHSPDRLHTDNARYILYSCSGGYPIGEFAIYLRSPIAEQGETERTQAFFIVGFDFYGKRRLSRFRPLRLVWEKVHNRVTSHVLNRFKRLCEWRFQRLQAGK